MLCPGLRDSYAIGTILGAVLRQAQTDSAWDFHDEKGLIWLQDNPQQPQAAGLLHSSSQAWGCVLTGTDLHIQVMQLSPYYGQCRWGRLRLTQTQRLQRLTKSDIKLAYHTTWTACMTSKQISTSLSMMTRYLGLTSTLYHWPQVGACCNATPPRTKEGRSAGAKRQRIARPAWEWSVGRGNQRRRAAAPLVSLSYASPWKPASGPSSYTAFEL